MLDDRAEADVRFALAQCPDHVAQIALRLAQVVRLCEALAGKQLVGDLARTAAGVWVVDARTARRPFDVWPSRRQRGAAQLAAHAAVALRVDDDRAHSEGDRAGCDPRLRDRLARARGTHHERVPSPALCAERNRDGTAALIEPEHQLLPPHPALRAAARANSEHRRRRERAQKILRTAAASRDLRQVRAGFDVFAVPAPAADACHERRDDQRHRRSAKERPRDRHQRQRAGRPAPVQVPAAHRSRGDRPQHNAEGEVKARRQQPVDQFVDRRRGVDRVFGKCVRGHRSHSLPGLGAIAKPVRTGLEPVVMVNDRWRAQRPAIEVLRACSPSYVSPTSAVPAGLLSPSRSISPTTPARTQISR